MTSSWKRKLDSPRLNSLPMFSQLVIGKAEFRQDLILEPLWLTITHTTLMRQDRPSSGHVGGPSGSAATIISGGPTSTSASQLSVIFPDTPWCGHCLQMGKIMCAHPKCWFLANCQVSAESSMSIYPHAPWPISRFSGMGKLDTPEHCDLKPTLYILLHTSCQKESALILLEEPPCHIPTLNIQLAPGWWICQQALTHVLADCLAPGPDRSALLSCQGWAQAK